MKLLKQLVNWFKSIFLKKKESTTETLGDIIKKIEKHEKERSIRLIRKYSNISGGKGYYKKAPSIQ